MPTKAQSRRGHKLAGYYKAQFDVTERNKQRRAKRLERRKREMPQRVGVHYVTVN